MADLEIVRIDSTQAVNAPAVNPPDDKKKKSTEPPIIMRQHDVTTASQEDAMKIAEFLNSKEKRQARENELRNYFLSLGYSEKDAKELAKNQVKNEQSQANAKITKVFIDQKAYNDYLSTQSKDSPYNVNLIDDPEVLEMIRGDRLKGPTVGDRAEVLRTYFKTDEKGQLIKDENGVNQLNTEKYKEEDLKKFFKTDENGELVKDTTGNYMFDSEKFKTNQKEEHLKKFYQTDNNGNLVKDANGQYIFDSDKYKTEMEHDVTAYRLTLSDRENAAQKRNYDPTDERNAITAAGLDYTFDKTWIYKGTLAMTAILTAIFGGVEATAEAHAHAESSAGCADADGDVTAVAHTENHLGQFAAIPLAITAMIVEDKDPKVDKREKAYEEFNSEPLPEEKNPCEELEKENEELKQKLKEKEEPPVTEEPVVEQKPEPKPEEPCYTIQEGVDVGIIKFGGYWHYANLYNDCTTGKKLTRDQLNELTQLLQPGHDSSIQKEGKTRILQPTVTLKDGTTVCLADEVERQKRIATMVTKGGGKAEMPLESRKIKVTPCDGGEPIYFDTVDEAVKWMQKQKSKC